MKVRIPGYKTIAGTPASIMHHIEEERWFNEKHGDDLLFDIQEIAARCLEVDLHITGTTYEERAESLLREMDANNIIEITEED